MPLSDRFAEYVAELHEICDNHRLRYGKPEDLSRLLEAFHDSEAFATDFGCVMRSIALRENFRATETELLTLVAVAWAGAGPDVSTPRFSQLIEELGGILTRALAHRVLAHRLGGLTTASARGSEKLLGKSSVLSDPTPELRENGSDVLIYRQRSDSKHGPEKLDSATHDLVLDQGSIALQNGNSKSSSVAALNPEQSPPGPIPFDEASERILARKAGRSNSSNYPLTYGLSTTEGSWRTLRLEPSMAEIIALGLTGLMVALLSSTGSLPIYRARVSVYLPSAIADTTSVSAKATGTVPEAKPPGLREASLLSGELTEKVAERLLARPHGPILRQDVISRGMRDLHLGGSETILYADLVAETAHQVKVTHLQPKNLYEVTCDSWDARFAATFCNALTDSLHDQPSIAMSSQDRSDPARTIDAALRPGSQVYPHWYLQGSVGLAVGCMVGILVGFVKRPVSETTKETT